MTLAELSKMREKQKQAAIARSVGWSEIAPGQCSGTLMGRERVGANWGKPIPDYLHSLDAIMPVIRGLSVSQADQFLYLLFERISRDNAFNDGGPTKNETFALLTATPAQLSDAYLATVL